MIRMGFRGGPPRVSRCAHQGEPATNPVGYPSRCWRGRRANTGLLQCLVPTPARAWRPRPHIVLVPIKLPVVALGARWLEVPADSVIEGECRGCLESVLNVGSVEGLQGGGAARLGPRPGGAG